MAGPGTANSISRRQRDRVMVHGYGLRSKKPTIRPRVVVVLRLGWHAVGIGARKRT